MEDWQSQAITAAISGIKDEPVLKADSKRLAAMKNRPEIGSAA
jgi:hypothetical protein